MEGFGRRKGEVALLAALAAGQTVRDAAKQAGVSEGTAWRRLQDPTFAEHVTALQSQALARAMAAAVDGMTEAVETLRRLLVDANSFVQLGAAKAILEVGPKLRDSVELEQRVVALEQMREATKGGQRWAS